MRLRSVSVRINIKERVRVQVRARVPISFRVKVKFRAMCCVRLSVRIYVIHRVRHEGQSQVSGEGVRVKVNFRVVSRSGYQLRLE